MIKVWTDAAEAGMLERLGARGGSFSINRGRLRARGIRNHAGPPSLVEHALRPGSVSR